MAAQDHLLNSKPAWYRGDFHAHTNESDGVLEPDALISLAKQNGLDFLAVTDHNSTRAVQRLSLQKDVLVIPGAEVTLDTVHFNVFGLFDDMDWMKGIFESPRVFRTADLEDTITDLIEEIHRSGLLISLNHPLLKPWECRIDQIEVGKLDCLEVWNDPSWPDNKTANPAAVAMWSRWLNEGHRVTAIGGSDFHRPQPQPGMAKPPERLGFPSTYVYADSFSYPALKKGLKDGRAYVSLGPEIAFTASMGGRTFQIGEDIGILAGQIELSGSVMSDENRVTARLVRNGETVSENSGPGNRLQVRYGEKISAEESSWYRLDVLNEQNEFLAISNPIFLGRRPVPRKSLFGDFL